MIEAKPNFTQVPNFIFDLMGQLSSSELVVLLFICRKTYGWHKVKDNISLSQMIEGTGLSKPTVVYSLKSLLIKGILAKETNKKSGNLYVVLEPEIGSDGKEFYHGMVKNSTNQMVKNSTIQKKHLNKKEINKNIEENSNIQSSIFRKEEDNVSKLNVLSTINNKEEVPRIEGSEETDPRPPIESPENHARIDVEKNLGAELGKGSQNNEESLKIETIRERDNFMQQLSGINSVVRGNPPPELVEFIDSKQKLAKPIIDAFYGYFKTLNNSYGQEMKWDAKETKILKTQLLEAGIPIDRLLMWKPDFRSQDNPYYQVLEPIWRLKISRDKKNSDFFKKIFRPSTFTVKYTECLEPINYYKETVEEEDPNLDSKLEELNKKLTGG